MCACVCGGGGCVPDLGMRQRRLRTLVGCDENKYKLLEQKVGLLKSALHFEMLNYELKDHQNVNCLNEIFDISK